MKRRFLFLISLVNLLSLPSYAGTSTATSKATATLSSVCTISSQNVNFGQISLPVSAQSATSSMNVQCTNKSSYTISLAYGGVYGTGTNSNGDYWAYYTNNVSYNEYFEYDNTGSRIGILLCYSNGSVSASSGATISTCSPSHTPTGWIGAFNSSGHQTIGTAYTYGVMTGAAKGDTIGYFIQVPNNPSQVWNAGNYTYTTTGNGSTQSIPVVATIVPAQTADKYPVADMYFDTVTATISY